MKVLIYDIEADYLLLDASRIWCIVTKDLHTGEITRFTEENLDEAYTHLCQADRLIGHNSRGYDDPVTTRLLGGHSPDKLPPSIDTALLSRLVYPDRKNNPVGGHSLEAWGKFLKCYKGDHKDFSAYSPEMLKYCEQDVEVTHKVYNYLLPKVSEMPEAVKLEHRVASIITQQIQNGFTLHEENHSNLTRKLQEDRADLMDQLGDIPPFVDHVTMKSRWWVDAAGNKYKTKKEAPKGVALEKGDCIVKTVETPFNHQSGDHIVRLFKEKYNWKPKKFSKKSGKPETSKDVLKTLKYPEAKVLTQLSVVDKALGTYALAWERFSRNGKIHGSVISIGTGTYRMSHNKPNMNVPKVGKPYGVECRSCFRARDGFVLVGCDAAGLQERGLAHYMARWDNRKYAIAMESGSKADETDSHSLWCKALGYEPSQTYDFGGNPGNARETAKTHKYCVIFGGFPPKQASILGISVQEMEDKIEEMYRRLTGLKEVKTWLETACRLDGYIIGLDGRKVNLPQERVALAFTLQAFEVVIMKQALVIFYDSMVDKYGPHGIRWGLCGNFHDEFQTECEPEIAEDVARLAEASIRKSGEHYNLNIRLDGEAKTGLTWDLTH